MTNITLTAQQTELMAQIKKFLETPGGGVFILKGYAGTGKTTLLQQLGLSLKKEKKSFVMLAPTGRAASVLRARTGLDAHTIHSELYVFSKVDGEPDDDIAEPAADQFGQMRLMFTTRTQDPEEEKLYIVDEASMVSDEPGDDLSYAHFGSGHLLSDLLHAVGTNKIIFSGDPAQLPPICSVDSPALSEAFMKRQGRTVFSYELSEILRHKSDNEILKLATRVRTLTSLPVYPQWMKLPATESGQVSLLGYESMKDAYFNHVNAHGFDDSIAVCHSNHNCADINKSLRQKLYGLQHAPLRVNDLLMVTQNNHLVPLSNGDFVTVTYVGEKTYHIGMCFLNVRVRGQLSGLEHECLLCEEMLFNGHANLMHQQQRLLMIDFSKRMRRRKIKPGSEAYLMGLQQEPYLNSLRVNFGYAVTCNKSQGGEWANVFFFLHKGMYVMPRPSLARWWYTGITRAKEKLYISTDWWIG